MFLAPDLFNSKGYKQIAIYRTIVWTVIGRDTPEPSGYIGPLTGLGHTTSTSVKVPVSVTKGTCTQEKRTCTHTGIWAQIYPRTDNRTCE
jgi:hypothetical protein